MNLTQFLTDLDKPSSLILNDSATVVPHWRERLQPLLDMVPVDDYVFTLSPPTPSKRQPVAQIQPHQFRSFHALYLSSGVPKQIADYAKGHPEIETKEILMRRFTEDTRTPVFAANPPLITSISRPVTPRMPPAQLPRAFATFCTPGFTSEALLLIKSLNLFHPEVPVYVLADSDSVRRITEEFPQVACRACVNAIDVERRAKEWNNTRNPNANDHQYHGLMSFKMDAIEFADRDCRGVMFLDSDIIFLDQLSPIPACDFAVTAHYIDPKVKGLTEAAGAYNAGLIYVNSALFLQWWRNTYMSGLLTFADQGCLNDAALRFDMQVLPWNVNYGNWRMWNHTPGAWIDYAASPPHQLCEFAGVTVRDGIWLHDRPLQSIHIHTFAGDLSKMHIMNTGLRRMFDYILATSKRDEHQELNAYYDYLRRSQ